LKAIVRYANKIAVTFRGLLSLPVNKAFILVISTYTLLWGLWVANPFWEVFSRSPLYTSLNSLFPEVVWGVFAIVCGLAMSWGILHEKSDWLCRGAYIGFIHWIVISIGYFLGDWQHTGGITALTIAALSALTYLNSRVNRDNLPLERKHVKI